MVRRNIFQNQEYKSVICTNIANDYSEIESVEQYSNEFDNFQTNFDSTGMVCGRTVKKEDLYSIQVILSFKKYSCY